MTHASRPALPALRFLAPLAGVAALLYGCQDSLPTAAQKPPVYMAQAVQCTVSVPQQSMTCNSAEASIASSPERALEAVKRAMTQHQGHPVSEALVGHPYIAITSQNFFHDVAGDRVLADVKVQNLMAEPAGTVDGTNYDGVGVNVFFDTPPAAPVTINNATGTGTFVTTNQTYFQYPQLVPANGSTALQSWVFGLHGQPSFSFIVFVSTQVPTDPALVVIPAHTFPSIASGFDQICAIRAGNQAYCWGNDSLGQFGDGRSWTSPIPVVTLGGHIYSSVAAGPTHGCAIEQSTLAGFCWGDDSLGALGDGGSTTQSTPVAVAGNHLWTGISAGANHGCAVESATNKAFCWGDNTNGQVGKGSLGGNVTVPTTVIGGHAFVTVVSGHDHPCALTAAGAAWCWGANANMQLGNNAFTDSPTPVAVLGGHVWKQITAGGNHTCGVDNGNVAWCWGSDATGELGDNGFTDEGIPVAVEPSDMGTVKAISAGARHTCAIDNTAAAAGWCWGDGSSGQLGDGSLAGPITTPFLMDGTFKWNSIAAGESHTCGIDNTSHARCWGAGEAGQMGDGQSVTTTEANTPVTGDTYSALATGGDFACGISIGKPGTGWCWGSAQKSALGNGFLMTQSAPLGVLGFHQFTFLAAGRNHTCGIDVAGAGWCWGENDFDELGTGDETPHAIPVSVSGGHFFSQISAMFVNTCARATGSGDQPTFCWGSNGFGEIGDGTTTTATVPTAPAGGVTTFAAISAGLQHTCAVQSGGSVYCWGDNSSGQLGDGSLTQHLQPNLVPAFSGNAIGAGFLFTCAIESAAGHRLWCWGRNTEGQLGIGNNVTPKKSPTLSPGTRSYSQITLGAFYACALETGTGNAYCWGNNSDGELGDGTTNPRNSPTIVAGPTQSFVTIQAGKTTATTTCASTATGIAYCWGVGYGNKPTLVAEP